MRSAQDITVSVVVPVYKVEEYLRQCVDSILAQTHKNLQVVLVDDGSPDDCGRIIDEYASKDKRVQCIHKANGGLSSARNAGKAVAKGEYISFIDSDDFVDCRFIEVLLADVLSSDSDISACYFDSFIEKSTEIDDPWKTPQRLFSRSEVICEMYRNDSIGWNAWNKLYKTQLFDNIDYPEGMICEDKATTYRLFLNSNKVSFRNVPLYHYRVRENSITGQKSSQYYMDSLSINSLMERDLKEFGLDALAKAYSAKCGLLIYEATRNLDGYEEIAEKAICDLKDNYGYMSKADYLGFMQKILVWVSGLSAKYGKRLLLNAVCMSLGLVDKVRKMKIK